MENLVTSRKGDPPDHVSKPLKLPKAPDISIKYGGKVSIAPNKEEGFDGCKLSFEDFSLRMSSSLLESIIIEYSGGIYYSTVEKLCKIVGTMPSLKDFHLKLTDYSCGWADGLPRLLSGVTSLRKFTLDTPAINRSEAKSLVDALLQHQTLQIFNLTLRNNGDIGSIERRRYRWTEVPMEQLYGYLKAHNNVLAHLEIFKDLLDDEVRLLADVLRDNKCLTYLRFSRDEGKRDCLDPLCGVGRIGDALRSNTVLKTLIIHGAYVWPDEMKQLVAALIPHTSFGSQSNSSLLHLDLGGCTVERGKGIEQLTTLIQYNTSLVELNVEDWNEFKTSTEASENVEKLFISLQSNRSLKRLKVGNNNGIAGNKVLGIIMDMLLENRTIEKIDFHMTPLDINGDADFVYAELRKRKQNHELWLSGGDMPLVIPNSARLFLCGNGEAGKTTICQKWEDLQPHERKKKRHIIANIFRSSQPPSNKKENGANQRTHGIEVHKMIWENMNISIWDLAGQEEYHSFHDLVVPNQSATGSCSLYFIVCNPHNQQMDAIMAEVHYWLKFVSSNTRRSNSYRPHVTILMTHFDLWQNDLHLSKRLKEVIMELKEVFEDHLNFDDNVEYFPMNNGVGLSSDALQLKKFAMDYLKLLSTKIPKVSKATIDLQFIVAKWNVEHLGQPFISWNTFSKICDEVEELKYSREGEESLLKKQFVATSLHEGGHIMYYKDIDKVIMNPQWFCHDIMGTILFKCSSLNPNCLMISNGTIPQKYLEEVLLASIDCKQFDKYFHDFLSIMMKMQICYKETDDNIMIPSILKSVEAINLKWPSRINEDMPNYSYVGTSLASKEPTATMLTAGFFPRLQVYLQKFVPGVAKRSYKLSKGSISFTYGHCDMHIEYKNDRIDIMSQSLRTEGSKLHSDIIKAINDLRSSSMLGCSGVDFEEFILRPHCVQELCPFEVRRNQIVSKKELKKMVISLGGLDYQHHWDENESKGLPGGFDLAETLLNQKEWQDVLESRFQALNEIEESMTSKLEKGVSILEEEDVFPGDLEKLDQHHDLKSSEVPVETDQLKKFLQNEFHLLHVKLDQHHDEVKEILRGLKKDIMQRQDTLYTRVCSNMNGLMEFSTQLLQSRVPKYPIFVPESAKNVKQVLKRMIPGLTSGRLYFFCEHKDGFHLAPQLGLDASYGTAATRKFGIVLFWGLSVATMLLKVGAHLGAGMGQMVPYPLLKEFMTMLDTPGLLDMAQPTGSMLEFLPEELKKNATITSFDNQAAEDWLVDFLKSKCTTTMSIHEKLGLNKVVYLNHSGHSKDKNPLVAWICDEHLESGRRSGTLRPLGNSFSV